jgi:hypothetical protein
MPSNFDKILSDLSKRSNLLKIIQEGKKPDEIKDVMVCAFNPFFENKQNLEDLVISNLVGDYHEILILSKTDYFIFFQECLYTYKRAKLIEPELCFEGIALFEKQMNEATGRFWSVYLFQKDLCELEDDDFLFECIEKIGELCEGIAKPFLKSLFFQVKISIGEKPDFKKIELMSFGKLVNELVNKSGYPELFCPRPKKVRLHDWRNISYHHSATIKDSIITCTYGEENQKVIKLSKRELVQTCENIFLIFKTIKLALKIFAIDNIREIKKFEKHWVDASIRKEIEFQELALAMMSQGFEISKFDFNKNETSVKVIDVTDVEKENIIIRVAHSSQFLILFWLFTKSDVIKIEYQNKKHLFLISVAGSDCQNAHDGVLASPDFITKINIVDFVTGQVI